MPGPAWRVVLRDAPGGRRKLIRILGINAALDGMPFQYDIPLANVEFFSCRNTNLRLYQIDSGNRFRNRDVPLAGAYSFR